MIEVTTQCCHDRNYQIVGSTSVTFVCLRGVITYIWILMLIIPLFSDSKTLFSRISNLLYKCKPSYYCYIPLPCNSSDDEKVISISDDSNHFGYCRGNIGFKLNGFICICNVILWLPEMLLVNFELSLCWTPKVNLMISERVFLLRPNLIFTSVALELSSYTK